jgi:hypothetical protein
MHGYGRYRHLLVNRFSMASLAVSTQPATISHTNRDHEDERVRDWREQPTTNSHTLS